ncbi:MAG: hypothetical protein AB199_01755 [Parcubacteria bacterium C7867-004]|nr:MAG: hypothetical protein AB199_01755 [Parcubacteria bacterium C7867-004]
MTDPLTRQTALSFLKERAFGVLATVSPEGEPRARSVYYASDDSFGIFFLTLSGTSKVEDINNDHHAAFVVSAEDVPRTIQIEGVISELTDTATIDPIVQELMDTLMKNGPHFAPLTHLDAGRVLFYKITPSRVRWADFTKGDGTDEVFSQLVP